MASGSVSTASNKTRATRTRSPRKKNSNWLDNVSPVFHCRQNLIESEFPISIPFLRKTIRPRLPQRQPQIAVAAAAGQAWLLLTVLLTLWPVTWLDAGTPHGTMIPQRPVRSSRGSLSDRQRQHRDTSLHAAKRPTTNRRAGRPRRCRAI